ncbi:MAG: response regulator transcription factor [Flavobacteriales bacterium]|nr:response regulator transcription factor [Flavobacteriales bacterium]
MKNRKILIIDDDQYIRLLLQYLLERSYDIEVRENGHEALLYLQEGNIPDMIISDLDMPVMTGNAFLDNIKQSSFFNSIPLIVLSAKENSLERIECLKKGADDYMMKPFNPEELKIRMSNIFQRMNLAR